MAKVIKLDEFIKRQKEVFNTYVETNGREVDLKPYIAKYSSEDDTIYSDTDIFKYLDLYIKSNLITDAEVDAYNKTRLIPGEIIFKRGKEIVGALIQSQGNIYAISRYKRIYAEEDGKLSSYNDKYLIKCRDYYLSHTNNNEIKMSYQNVMDLAKRGKYDIELINRLLQMPDDKTGITFINQINISKISLRKLIDEYKTVYPANRAEIKRLEYMLKEAFRFNDRVVKFIEQKSRRETLRERLLNLHRILEEYLIQDIFDISELFPKYNFNEYKFREVLKDGAESRDVLLKSLIDKYQTKDNVVLANFKTIIENILRAYNEGINYGNGYREINYYDVYLLKQGYSNETIIKFAYRICSKEDLERLFMILSVYTTSKAFNNTNELVKSLDEQADKDLIDYLQYANIPLSKEMYYALKERYQTNDIELEIPKIPAA